MKMILLRCLMLAVLVCFSVVSVNAEQYAVSSPNQKLTIQLNTDETLTYSVSFNNSQVIKPSAIGIHLSSGLVLGENPVVESTENHGVDEILHPLFGKNKDLPSAYHELVIHFQGDYAIILRAYDEGVAYRFQTFFDQDIVVESEDANFIFNEAVGSVFPIADTEMRSWERAYDTYGSLGDIDQTKFCITPALFRNENLNIVIAESDLFDYPGMYLQPNSDNSVKGKWAHYPKTVSDPDDVYAYHRVLERESYLAQTTGTRTFPWRVIIVNNDDKELLNNELIYKLACPSKLENTSWIKPGKSAWEWWHDAILETDHVSSGLDNLSFDLYKYYIDFAAEYKLEYMTMDAGWSTDYAAQVCNYAASKNVKVIMWDFINLPIENPERLTQIKNLGAAGVKVDLIERDDQVAINWLEKLAKECAKRELMLIIHGCPKPTGLQRTYPNIVNFEAVRGAECDKWDRTPSPEYHTQFPFIRMLAGPLDYTPGSMRNVHTDVFEPVPHGIPMTMGTKAHELAMYVLFDQPLGYLCDSPVEYRKNMIAMNFLKKVPTTWDKTVPLDGKVGEYAVVARKKGDDWYLGAMTNSKRRSIAIDFSFLDGTGNYEVEVYRDNEQTETDAKVLAYETITVNKKSVLNFDLGTDGGLVMYLKNSTVTGMIDQKQPTKINLFLSADRNWLTVQSIDRINEVQIFDLLGRLHTFEKFPLHTADCQLNIESLRSGVYVAGIGTLNKQIRQKFVK